MGLLSGHRRSIEFEAQLKQHVWRESGEKMIVLLLGRLDVLQISVKRMTGGARDWSCNGKGREKHAV